MARGGRRAPTVRARRGRVRRGTAPRDRHCRARGLVGTGSRHRHSELRRLPADVRQGHHDRHPGRLRRDARPSGVDRRREGRRRHRRWPDRDDGLERRPGAYGRVSPPRGTGRRAGGGVPRSARPPAAAARTTGSGVPAGSRTGAGRSARTGSRRPDADAGGIASTRGPTGSHESVVPAARRLADRSVVRGTDDRGERERAGRRGDTRPLLCRSGLDAGPGRGERRRRLRGGVRARGAVPGRPRHLCRHVDPSVAGLVGVRRAGGRVPGLRARRQRDALAKHPTDSGRGDGRGEYGVGDAVDRASRGARARGAGGDRRRRVRGGARSSVRCRVCCPALGDHSARGRRPSPRCCRASDRPFVADRCADGSGRLRVRSGTGGGDPVGRRERYRGDHPDGSALVGQWHHRRAGAPGASRARGCGDGRP